MAPVQDNKEGQKLEPDIPDALFEMLGEEPLTDQTVDLSLSEEIMNRWNVWRLRGVKPEELSDY